MGLIDRIKTKMFLSWNTWFREHVFSIYKRRGLKNKNVSIFCNNCAGACIAHDLNLQFRSPFVNLWLYPKDYIKFCENIEYYIEKELVFTDPNKHGVDYPVALLGDICIFFQHYHSEEEAKECWNKRKKRINKDNICCLLVERDGCTHEDLLRFSKLPYATASLVHVPMPELSNSHYIRGYEKDGEVGNSIEYKPNQYFGSRYYDDFDYVRFFNSNINISQSPSLQ